MLNVTSVCTAFCQSPVACCWELLRKVCGQTFSYVQKDAATPNNVESVYTGLKNNKRMITCYLKFNLWDVNHTTQVMKTDYFTVE